MISFKSYITEARSSANDKIIAKLEDLSSKLSKYAHRWGENTSSRMYNWVDTYNKLKEDHPEAWKLYCQKHKYSTSHDAYDNMA